MSVPTSAEPREAQKEIPLQTIELDKENPKILTLHSTISSAEQLKIVTDYFDNAADILENATATCLAETTKVTTHDTQGPRIEKIGPLYNDNTKHIHANVLLVMKNTYTDEQWKLFKKAYKGVNELCT
ncbi:uncharacterized protein LOC127857237 [Dreissena polymorpha]|uniref:uncharacterized protein LOC127857237 n=1 Tax=Dreissena polymorpha TaxID=45954 RepID=UPI0022650FD1|nr:uncharacterized protein LOC127857237 [Dreissena polymorpha]